MNIDKIKNTKIEDLAAKILNKNVEELTDKELELMYDISSTVFPVELTISAGETRQVRQYESNNYHLSVKIDLSSVSEIMKAKIASSNSVEDLLDTKRVLYNAIDSIYKTHENVLRSMIREQQEEDGIKDRG